jgi:hypothetical protein
MSVTSNISDPIYFQKLKYLRIGWFFWIKNTLSILGSINCNILKK